ncbi:helix-turn-helix domain-containing protein [Blautia sp.]|uniref:helix-turn-helix domain-containing protein n=1 Tax=Blautia sp. TaxID=1955243 RepID=UPI0026722DAC|nr:helix-turn-helix transcriptional regulator [uncultured Blautia sp.]
MIYDTKMCGKRIQLLRKSKMLTQLQLAMRVRSTDKHIAGIEQGARGASIDLLVELAKEFDVSLDYLVFGKTEIDKAELMLELDRLSQQIERLKRRL